MPSEWERFRDAHGTFEAFLQKSYLGSGSPVPSNIPPLDAITCGGFRPGLHVLGGEPGAGKSALGLYIAMLSAMSGTNVMFASLEMSRTQCMERCLSCLSLSTGRPFGWARTWELAQRARDRQADALGFGRAHEFLADLMENDPVGRAVARMKECCSSLLIADGQSLHEVGGLEQEARKGRAAGLELLFVDYLQYLSVDGITDELARVSTASKRLNMLGVELGIPVVALASCSRAGNAKGKAPSMHDFKGSGDIEYNAVSCMVIDRDPDDGTGTGRRLHVVKDRAGGVTSPETCIRLRFDGEHNSFDLTD